MVPIYFEWVTLSGGYPPETAKDLYYLLRSKEIKVSKEWISEKDIPGGATFFRSPHKIPTQLIEQRYGKNIRGFKEICEQLSGSRIDMADAVYSFQISPRIPASVLFWNGDDEFQPESKIGNVQKCLHGDILTDRISMSK